MLSAFKMTETELSALYQQRKDIINSMLTEVEQMILIGTAHPIQKEALYVIIYSISEITGVVVPNQTYLKKKSLVNNVIENINNGKIINLVPLLLIFFLRHGLLILQKQLVACDN